MGASQLPGGCQGLLHKSLGCIRLAVAWGLPGAAAQILGVHTRVGGIRLLQHQPPIITSHQTQHITYTNSLAVSPRLRQPTSPR